MAMRIYSRLTSVFYRSALVLYVALMISSSLHAQYAVKWEYKTEGEIFATPLVDENCVYIGSGDHKVYAIQRETGEKIWEFSTNGGVHSSPMLADNLLVFGSRDGNLYALDKNSGKEIWKFSTKGEKINGPWDYYLSSPTTDGKMIYWGSGDGHVYALEADTGELGWKYESKGIIHADPVVSGGKVFIGSFDGNLYALNKLNGELMWKFKTLGASYFPRGEIQKAVLVDNGTIYFGSRDYNIYALDADTGSVKWNMREPAGWIISTPIAHGDHIFFGTSDAHKFYCLDKNYGNIVWTTALRMRVFGSAVVDRNHIVFGTFDGKIVGADVKTGKQLWEFQTRGSKENYASVFDHNGEFKEGFSLYGRDMIETERKILDLGAVLCTPVIDDHYTLYFGSADGYLYALSLED